VIQASLAITWINDCRSPSGFVNNNVCKVVFKKTNNTDEEGSAVVQSRLGMLQPSVSLQLHVMDKNAQRGTHCNVNNSLLSSDAIIKPCGQSTSDSHRCEHPK
jgi:hypothetical protein